MKQLFVFFLIDTTGAMGQQVGLFQAQVDRFLEKVDHADEIRARPTLFCVTMTAAPARIIARSGVNLPVRMPGCDLGAALKGLERVLAKAQYPPAEVFVLLNSEPSGAWPDRLGALKARGVQFTAMAFGPPAVVGDGVLKTIRSEVRRGMRGELNENQVDGFFSHAYDILTRLLREPAPAPAPGGQGMTPVAAPPKGGPPAPSPAPGGQGIAPAAPPQKEGGAPSPSPVPPRPAASPVEGGTPRAARLAPDQPNRDILHVDLPPEGPVRAENDAQVARTPQPGENQPPPAAPAAAAATPPTGEIPPAGPEAAAATPPTGEIPPAGPEAVAATPPTGEPPAPEGEPPASAGEERPQFLFHATAPLPQPPAVTKEGVATGWREVDPPADDPDWVDNVLRDHQPGLGSWQMVGASRRGKMHAHKGIFREDSFALGQAADWHFMVVADGGGSCPLSRVGSKLAADTAVAEMGQRVAQMTRAEMKPEEIARMALEHGMRMAYARLEQEAQTRGRPLKDFGTTFLAVVHRPAADSDVVGVLQVGDGLVVAEMDDGTSEILAEPDVGETASVTLFLTSKPWKEWVDRAQVRRLQEKRPRLLAAMCDGVGDDLIPYPERLPIFFARMADKMGQDQPAEALLDWLGYNVRGSFDDRTVTLIYQPGLLGSKPATAAPAETAGPPAEPGPAEEAAAPSPPEAPAPVPPPPGPVEQEAPPPAAGIEDGAAAPPPPAAAEPPVPLEEAAADRLLAEETVRLPDRAALPEEPPGGH